MKKLVLAIIMAFVGLGAWAQSDSLKNAVSRIEALEKLAAQQAAQINQLTSKVEEVTAQNLALKKKLNLTPVVPKAKIDNMDYRVLEVKGDPITKNVHVVISAENTGDVDYDAFFNHGPNFEIIDDLGSGYNNNELHHASIEGITKELISKTINFHPKTPLIINLDIKPFKTDASYIKFLQMDYHIEGNWKKVIFENLPIKWVEAE